jgi:DNA-directed RNA polymerase beta subunit
LESVFREIFPVESYDKTVSLEYIRYELGKPRYTPDECRQLRLTYGKPMKVWLRLNREQPIEEEVYLGDIPVMLGGGEFIINGAERVVVSQLHRSPGVDFVEEVEATTDRKLAQLSRDSRAWELDRDQCYQEGQLKRSHRSERQVFRDDFAACHERRNGVG